MRTAQFYTNLKKKIICKMHNLNLKTLLHQHRIKEHVFHNKIYNLLVIKALEIISLTSYLFIIILHYVK